MLPQNVSPAWTARRNWIVTALLTMACWVCFPLEPCQIAGAESLGVTEHPVSVIKARVFVNRSSITIRLLVQYADDLELFYGLEPGDDGYYDEDRVEELTEKHGEYLGECIQIFDGEGNQLQQSLTDVIGIEFPDEGIMGGTLMEYSLGYAYEIRMETPPKFLTIQHLIDDSEFLNPVEIDLEIKQAGPDGLYDRFGIRFDQPETRQLTWSEEVSDASDEEIGAWLDSPPSEDEVGIESYSSSYSFIYITEYEVRHELLIPLATLATMIDFERAERGWLTIEEQDAAMAKIEALFTATNPLTIDAIEVKPVVDRIDFYGLDMRDFASRAPRRKISMVNGRVGIILSYSTKGTPGEVVVTWDLFNDALKVIDAVVIAFDEVSKTKFARYKAEGFKPKNENVYVWSNPGRAASLPVTSVTDFVESVSGAEQAQSRLWVAAGAWLGMSIIGVFAGIRLRWKTAQWVALLFVGMAISLVITLLVPSGRNALLAATGARPEVDAPTAERVFQQLHKNLFRAFDYKNEEDVYDTLSASVDGQLRQKLYLDIRRSLAMQTQGGAISNIDEVQYVAGELTEPIRGTDLSYPGFAFRCRWNLVGSVEHWAHIHERTNEYEAVFHVNLVEGSWKITEQRIVDESQGTVRQWRRKLTKS